MPVVGGNPPFPFVRVSAFSPLPKQFIQTKVNMRKGFAGTYGLMIVRHTKIRMDANPYIDTQYFIDRKFEHGMKRLSGRFKIVWKNQNGCCYHCGMPMEISDNREIFFKVPKSEGGLDEVRNMAYVHSHCQSLYTERRSKE